MSRQKYMVTLPTESNVLVWTQQDRDSSWSYLCPQRGWREIGWNSKEAAVAAVEKRLGVELGDPVEEVPGEALWLIP